MMYIYRVNYILLIATVVNNMWQIYLNLLNIQDQLKQGRIIIIKNKEVIGASKYMLVMTNKKLEIPT